MGVNVHLPPQIGLSIKPLPREVLGKSQQHKRVFFADAVQELRTVDCSLLLLGQKLDLINIWACHVSLIDFQRLEHVYLKIAIV